MRLHVIPPGCATRSVDERKVLRRSHENPVVQQLYDDFLEKPNSHKVGGVGRWPAAGSGCIGLCSGQGGALTHSSRS